MWNDDSKGPFNSLVVLCALISLGARFSVLHITSYHFTFSLHFLSVSVRFLFLLLSQEDDEEEDNDHEIAFAEFFKYIHELGRLAVFYHEKNWPTPLRWLEYRLMDTKWNTIRGRHVVRVSFLAENVQPLLALLSAVESLQHLFCVLCSLGERRRSYHFAWEVIDSIKGFCGGKDVDSLPSTIVSEIVKILIDSEFLLIEFREKNLITLEREFKKELDAFKDKFDRVIQEGWDREEEEKEEADVFEMVKELFDVEYEYVNPKDILAEFRHVFEQVIRAP